MSEITREALEGMGFEKYGSIREFRSGDYQVVSLAFSGCDFEVFNNATLLPHIRTLPQLRRLIRSLFGDDALPRRELSSITDEECLQFIVLAHRLVPNIVILEPVRTHDFVSISSWSRGYSLKIDKDGFFDEGDSAFELSSEGIINALSYLVNVCDFHLPAFHDDKGGE